MERPTWGRTTGWRAMGAAGVACVMTVAATGPAAAQQTRTVDERRSVSGDVTVEIDAHVRNVVVRGWDRDELRVQGDVDMEREELDIEGGGSSVDISVDVRDGRWEGRDGGPRELSVSVPRGARVVVELAAGRIDVEGVHGDMELESVSGDVSYAGDAVSVEAESVSGDVTVEAPSATTTRAGSVSGDLRLRVAGGLVEVESVSGDVDLRASAPLDRLEVESVSGRVRADAAPSGRAVFQVETHSGSVELRLPADLDARLEARTFSGDIRNAFGGEARRTDRYSPGQELRQTVGGGAARISVQTFSGRIGFTTGGG